MGINRVSRSVIVGLVGAAIILIALALSWWSNPDILSGSSEAPSADVATESPLPAPPPAQDADQNETATDVTDATPSLAEIQPPTRGTNETDSATSNSNDSPSAELAQPVVTADDAVEPEKSPTPPTFDVVRIDPSGDAVIAGRSEPGSKVTLLDAGKDLGVVDADGRGEWVFLPTTPLQPGPHELRLVAELDDGTVLVGDGAVVLVVPKPGEDVAGRTVEDGTVPQQPVVVLIPDEDQVGAELIQSPGMAPADPEIAEDAAPMDAVRETGMAALPSTDIAEPNGVESDDGSMSVETIDYDAAGNISIAGTAPIETTVIAYLDGRAIGSGKVDSDRNWRVNPDREVLPGVYTLRLDAIRIDAVISRLEIPFSRAAPIAELDGDAFIIVQPGNSLWRIARRTLGSGVSYTVIYEANEDQIRDPDLIYPGQVFEIPR